MHNVDMTAPGECNSVHDLAEDVASRALRQDAESHSNVGHDASETNAAASVNSEDRHLVSEGEFTPPFPQNDAGALSAGATVHDKDIEDNGEGEVADAFDEHDDKDRGGANADAVSERSV